MIGTLKVSDTYMDLLGTLPDEDKIDLISKLVKSMKKAVAPTKKPKDIFAGFSSNWGGDMTTEEYAEALNDKSFSYYARACLVF